MNCVVHTLLERGIHTWMACLLAVATPKCGFNEVQFTDRQQTDSLFYNPYRLYRSSNRFTPWPTNRCIQLSDRQRIDYYLFSLTDRTDRMIDLTDCISVRLYWTWVSFRRQLKQIVVTSTKVNLSLACRINNFYLHNIALTLPNFVTWKHFFWLTEFVLTNICWLKT